MANLKPKPTTPEPKAEDAALAEYSTIELTLEKVPVTLEQVRKFIAPTATQSELFLFMGACRSFGLNPLTREIHFVKYGNRPGTIVVGYEVYLKRAETTGKLDGWEVHIETDTIGEKAVITIHRTDRGHPFVWETYRHEFDKATGSGKGDNPWNTMPNFMMKKVCIGQGFRMCFPGVLGAMPYLPEEVSGMNGYAPPNMIQTPQNQQTLDELRVDYFKATHTMFKDDEERRAWQSEVTGGKGSVTTWTYDEYDLVFARLAQMQEEPEEEAIEMEVEMSRTTGPEEDDVIDMETPEELDLLAGKDNEEDE